MIGGYYVTAIEPVEGGDKVALIAGPFATWAEADKLGPSAVTHIGKVYPKLTNLEWGIGEFWFHRLVLGTRNAELWAKPTPVER